MKIDFTEGLKKYAANTGYLFLEKILRMIVTLTAWVLVIRYLGPEQFGLFSFALSFVVLFSILPNLGANEIVVKELIKNRHNEKRILSSVFFLNFSGSLFAVILISTITKILGYDSYLQKIILVMSFRLIFYSFNYIDFYFQSYVKSKYSVYSQILSLFCTSALCLLFIYLRLPLIYFVFVVVIESCVLSLSLISFYLIKQKEFPIWRSSLEEIKKILKYSWPVIMCGMAIPIYKRIDQIMIKVLLDTASVGYYSAAVRISEEFYFIPIIITGSLYPAIVKAKSIGKNVYEDRLRALFSILFWIAILVAVFITIISIPLVHFLFGHKYSAAGGVLQLHIWAAIFVFLGIARAKWAINENLQIYLMFYMIIGAVVNVVLNFFLIPLFNIKGAAIATVFSSFVAAFLSSLFNKKTMPIFFLQLESINFLKVFRKAVY